MNPDYGTTDNNSNNVNNGVSTQDPPSATRGAQLQEGLKDPDAEITPAQAKAEGLPIQKHAGAVGYGPEYVNKNEPTIGEKMTGVKEQFVGKLTNNPELVEKGRERKTGQLKRKEQAKDDKNPFGLPDDQTPAQGYHPNDNPGKQPLGGDDPPETSASLEQNHHGRNSHSA